MNSETAAACDNARSLLEAAIQKACAAIAPSWPLDRSIAVNPHWHRIPHSLCHVAARMRLLGDIRVFPDRSLLKRAWTEGRITHPDLLEALSMFSNENVPALDPVACVAALDQPLSQWQLPLLIDLLEQESSAQEKLSYRQAIAHQVSQTCAAYFDAHQADWQPDRGQGLYAFWRESVLHDHGISVLMGLPRLVEARTHLPQTSEAAEQWVMERLNLPDFVWADYLESILLTVSGWASWCAYLLWEAQLKGETSPYLRELLAIRLAWGALLLESRDDKTIHTVLTQLRNAWGEFPALLKHVEKSLSVDEVWQIAYERGYQRELQHVLSASAPLEQADRIEVQAVFCIDVRSEPFRRALEQESPAIQTIGFAGFFGLPMAYTPLATAARRPQLPGLLAPTIEVTETCIAPEAGHEANEALTARASLERIRNYTLATPWKSATKWPISALQFVESAGFIQSGRLLHWLFLKEGNRKRGHHSGLSRRRAAVCRPVMRDFSLSDKVSLAKRVLKAMGLDKTIAPLVILVGHASQSTNNAHAAALECGACCGQSGEINARVLAGVLNQTDVRDALLCHGLIIPERTRFVAAVHNTTTDEIEGFDLDLLPEEARTRWSFLATAFISAGAKVRAERAEKLGIDSTTDPSRLLSTLKKRASDGAQTRPELGLAGNASFIIASRKRTRGMPLGGRAFLHDYDADKDSDGELLEQLMTAPLLVTHWINWQYHASTCEPVHFGSGNKLLHNVVGGVIGVFEGNGGDLRIGLSRQSLHNGHNWLHEPLRLTVVIDAPARSIERIMQAHEVVKHLIENHWLELWRFDDTAFQRYERGRWVDLPL